MKFRKKTLLLLLLFEFLCFGSKDNLSSENNIYQAESEYSYKGDLWRPIFSLALPGFDQYLNGQYRYGLLYTSSFVAANIWAKDSSIKYNRWKNKEPYLSASKEERFNIQRKSAIYNEFLVSRKLMRDIGSLSLFHSFRTAANSRKKFGQYTFMDFKKEETPKDLLLAPFHFNYLKRPSTWVALLGSSVFHIVAYNHLIDKNELKRTTYSISQGKYVAGMSYQAGVFEEAQFRGVLQPILREYSGSSLTANIIQGTLFGLIHNNNNTLPFTLGWGYYLGWLTEENNWSIGEGIFIHTWSDIISISTSYMLQLKQDKNKAVIPLPAFNFIF